MNDMEIGRLAYLVLLGLAVGGYLITENRRNLGKVMRQFLAWALIFIGVIAGYGLWNDIRSDVLPRQAVLSDTGQVIADRRFDGHFYLDLLLNDQPVTFMVDTGATDVVLTRQDAARIGIDTGDLAFSSVAMTANGEVRTAATTLENIELEGIRDRNLRVYVNDGEMDTSLLGMSYLRRYAKIEIAGDKLILTR